MMISDENENQFYQFLIFLTVYYMIDPDVITLYQKKKFEILTNFIRTPFLRPNDSLSWFIFPFNFFLLRGGGAGRGSPAPPHKFYSPKLCRNLYVGVFGVGLDC